MPLPNNVPGRNQRTSPMSRATGNRMPVQPSSRTSMDDEASLPPIQGMPTNNKSNNTQNPDIALGRPTHVDQYDFDERGMAYERLKRSSQRPPVANSYDGPEDDTFVDMSVEEQLEWEEEEAAEQARQSRFARQQRRAREAQKPITASTVLPEDDDMLESESLDDDLSEEEPKPTKKKLFGKHASKTASNKTTDENEKDDSSQNVFIDKKKKQLKPFGGRKIKEHDLDPRKNLQKNRKIMQSIFVGAILLVVGFGGYKTFFPADSVTPAEIQEIVKDTTGLTNFPLESGRGFATDFMKAYLTVNSDSVSQQVLGYYYSGTMGNGDNENRTAAKGFQQTILYGPTVYESKALTDYSARYTIGALVQPALAAGDTPAGTQPRWQFFNVNVYYNAGSGNFSITKDSPTVVPAAEVGQSSEIPASAPLGTGESDQALAKSLQSVVYGFLEGYAKSSPSNHTTLDQYVVTNPPVELLKGLNGTYTFAGDMNDAVKYEAYPTNDPSMVKVSVRVNWRTSLGTADSAARLEYTSTYVMTLVKQANGKYLVSKFSPQFYVAKEGEATSSEPSSESKPSSSSSPR